LDASDVIIFGTPTYMGGPAAQFKAFADTTSERWFKRVWVNKLAAGFTVSAGPSGDKFNTLIYLFTLAMQHGMVWVGQTETPFNEKGINRLSSFRAPWARPLPNPRKSPRTRPTSSQAKSSAAAWRRPPCGG
jgi:NAD(P)H dehydrogenase (quinone)